MTRNAQSYRTTRNSNPLTFLDVKPLPFSAATSAAATYVFSSARARLAK